MHVKLTELEREEIEFNIESLREKADECLEQATYAEENDDFDLASGLRILAQEHTQQADDLKAKLGEA